MSLPMTRLATAICLTVATLATTANADEAPIATAGSGQIASPATDSVQMIPPAPLESAQPAPQMEPARKIHGAVEVGVGTGGYRSAAAVATIPLGKTGEATIAVQKTEGRVRYQ